MGGQALSDGDRGQNWYVDPKKPIIIGHDTKHGSEHPHWDERANDPVDEDLAMDIANRGNMQAVVCRKDGRGPDAPLLVIFGRGRTKAARRANEILKELGKPPIQLKIEIAKGVDDKSVVLMALSENAHRKDNDAVTNAKALHRAVHVNKIPIAEACQAMNASVQTGQAWLRYFDLDASCQKALADEKISFTAVVELADLPRDGQKAKLKELLESGVKPTVARARRAKVDGKKAGGQKTRARETAYEPPSRRMIRKVVEHGKEHGVNAMGIAFLKWVLGERDPSTLGGLSGVLDDAGEK